MPSVRISPARCVACGRVPYLRSSRADRSLLHKNTGPFRIPLSPRAKNGLRLSCRSHHLDGAGISLPFNQFSFSCRPWTHRADRRVSDPGAWPLLRDGIFPGMWMTTMKKTLTVLAIGALSAAVGGCNSSAPPLAPSAAAERATTGAAAQPGAAVAAKPGTMTIVGIVIQPDGEFDVLEAAVVRAGLIDALNGTKQHGLCADGRGVCHDPRRCRRSGGDCGGEQP